MKAKIAQLCYNYGMKNRGDATNIPRHGITSVSSDTSSLYCVAAEEQAMGQYKYAPPYVFERLPYREPGIAYVYGLRLIGDEEIRYVGSTVNPRSRFTGHYVAANKDDLHANDDLADWLNANTYGVEMVILWDGPWRQRLRHEKDIASELSMKGNRLFNMRRPTRVQTKRDQHRRALWRDLLDKVLDN